MYHVPFNEIYRCICYKFQLLKELLGQHHLYPKTIKDRQIAIGENRIVIDGTGWTRSCKRYEGSELKSEATIDSDTEQVIVGVFPNPQPCFKGNCKECLPEIQVPSYSRPEKPSDSIFQGADRDRHLLAVKRRGNPC
jgi:hypothetical protein